MSTDLEVLEREAGLTEMKFERYGGDPALYALPLRLPTVRAIIAALKRAERVEAAARKEPENFGRDALYDWMYEVKAALADAPEGSDDCQHEFGALGAVSGDHCIHCGKRLSNAPGEEGRS